MLTWIFREKFQLFFSLRYVQNFETFNVTILLQHFHQFSRLVELTIEYFEPFDVFNGCYIATILR